MDSTPKDKRFKLQSLLGLGFAVSFVVLAVCALLSLGLIETQCNCDPEAWVDRMRMDAVNVLLAAESFEETNGRYPAFIAEMIEPAGQLSYGLPGLYDIFGSDFRYELIDGTPRVVIEGDSGKPEIWSPEDVNDSWRRRAKDTAPRSHHHFEQFEESVAKEALELLASNSSTTSWQAASMLREAGWAVTLVPQISALVLDETAPSEARYAASYALGGIGRWDYRPAVRTLLTALTSEDSQFRWYALLALEQMGPAATPAVGPIANALTDTDEGVRQAAVRALAAIGPGARSAVAALQDARTNAGSGMQETIDVALQRILGTGYE